MIPKNDSIVTTRIRRMGEVPVFTGVCLSTPGGYSSDWSQVPSQGCTPVLGGYPVPGRGTTPVSGGRVIPVPDRGYPSPRWGDPSSRQWAPQSQVGGYPLVRIGIAPSQDLGPPLPDRKVPVTQLAVCLLRLPRRAVLLFYYYHLFVVRQLP